MTSSSIASHWSLHCALALRMQLCDDGSLNLYRDFVDMFSLLGEYLVLNLSVLVVDAGLIWLWLEAEPTP